MNTKDIEEIIDEFWGKFAWCDMQNSEDNKRMNDWLRNTLTTLTQHHQAEVERAVEEERNRIAALCYQLPNDYSKMYYLIFNSPTTPDNQ